MTSPHSQSSRQMRGVQVGIIEVRVGKGKNHRPGVVWNMYPWVVRPQIEEANVPWCGLELSQIKLIFYPSRGLSRSISGLKGRTLLLRRSCSTVSILKTQFAGEGVILGCEYALLAGYAFRDSFDFVGIGERIGPQ